MHQRSVQTQQIHLLSKKNDFRSKRKHSSRPPKHHSKTTFPMSSIHKILTAATTASDNSSSRCSNNHSNITNAERIEWSRSTILGFIEDYRRQRVLWDPNTKGYHIKQTKYEALKALGNKYGTEVRSIRSKIKSLRSSFHREHGKVINGRRKGIHYQPMWFAYEAIRFILDSETLTTTTNTPTTLSMPATPTNAMLKSSPTATETATENTAVAATALALASTFALQRQTLERSLAAAQALISHNNNNNNRNENDNANDNMGGMPTANSEKLANLNKDEKHCQENDESNDDDVADIDDDGDYGAEGGEVDVDIDASPDHNSHSNGIENAAKQLLAEPYIMCAAEMGIQYDLLKAVSTVFNNNNNSAQINHNSNALTKHCSPKKSKSKTPPTTTMRVSTPTNLSNGRNSSSSDQHAVGNGIGIADVGAGAAVESHLHSSTAATNHTLNDNNNSPATHADEADHHQKARLAVVHANSALTAAAAASGSGACGIEANTVLRSDFDVDGQNYCNITADDVKTEIIESDTSEVLPALERSTSSTPTSLINYYKPNMRKRKANTQATAMERYIEDAFAMPSKQLRLQAQHQLNQQQQHSNMQHQAQQQRELFLSPAAKHSMPATKTSTTTTTSIINETTPQITQTKIPQQPQLEPPHQQQQTDEYGVFGEYVAITIRKLRTSKAKIVVKHLINNLLYEAELGKYDQGISSNRDPPELYKM